MFKAVLSVVMLTWLGILADTALVVPGVPPNQPTDYAAYDTTVADTVAVGSALVRQFPSMIAGRRVIRYRGIKVPAHGWLHGRSMFWRPPSDSDGDWTFVYAAMSEAGVVDTLYLSVRVVPDRR